MAIARWYPSVIATDMRDSQATLDPMLVPGGTHVGDNVAPNNYHVWQESITNPGGEWQKVSGNPTFGGPANTYLGDYPRMHWVSTGDAALAGGFKDTNRVRHFASPGTWLTLQWHPQQPSWAMQDNRAYGTSVLFPISPGGALKDYVMAIGGLDWNTNTILGTWEISLASADGSAKNWSVGADFQLFVPHYLNCGNVQPVILNPPAAGTAWPWTRGSMPLVQHQAFPEGTLLSIDKVVLTRAGSVTHHSDGNQRCVQLDFTVVPGVTPPTLLVTVPSANLGILPRGYYMLWLVTNQGTPSQAAWVKVTG